jgi:hypothetical protein
MILSGAQNYTECVVKDVSMKGIQVSLPLKLPPETFVKLSITLSDNFNLDLEVWVAWHRTVGDHNVYGLYFNKIKDADKDKLYQFIRNNFPEEIARQWWQGTGKGGERMETKKFEDRRIFARFSTKFPLRFIDVQGNREGEAQALDISAKGIGIVTNTELVRNTSLEMWLRIPDKGEPLYARGEVVWSKPEGENAYHTGVSLEKADLMGLSRVLRAA